FDTPAGNPVKEILLKLNLPDHRSILTDSKAKASKERLDVVKSLMSCIPKLEPLFVLFVLEMKGYFRRVMQTAEQGIKKIDVPSTSVAPVLTVESTMANNSKTLSFKLERGKALSRKSLNRGS
ncbi:hypothetical protein Tco_1322997, partial [Tanacetum coccineum]